MTAETEQLLKRADAAIGRAAQLVEGARRLRLGRGRYEVRFFSRDDLTLLASLSDVAQASARSPR